MGILFLIGPRGSGKTLAAENLTKLYGYRSCDTDHLAVAAAGRSISQIVSEEGWPAFRALEKAALFDAAAMMSRYAESFAIVATGGGAVLDPENRALMRESGLVVYLATPPEVAVVRLEKALCNASRPPLSSLEFADEIRTVMAEREQLYKKTAHCRVNAALSPKDLAFSLHDLILSHGGTP